MTRRMVAPTKPVPVTKNNIAYKVLTNVMDTMFEPEGRRLTAALDRIAEQNDELVDVWSQGLLGFYYGGERYTHSRGLHFVSVADLDSSLHDQMDVWLRDKATTKQDRDLVHQALFKCIFNWRDSQDFRNRMPDAVVPLLTDGMQQLPRTVPFEEAVCLDERGKRQFYKILPKIELYATARLIY